MPEPQTLMTGLMVGESPRWHEGRLWFSNWGAQEIVAVDLEGNSEVVARSPTAVGYSIDWLPGGGQSNRRVWAAVGGDGICLDAGGAVWCSVVHDGRPACVRVREGGQVLTAPAPSPGIGWP
jgi:sugar lactone lactonase YvrE